MDIQSLDTFFCPLLWCAPTHHKNSKIMKSKLIFAYVGVDGREKMFGNCTRWSWTKRENTFFSLINRRCWLCPFFFDPTSQQKKENDASLRSREIYRGAATTTISFKAVLTHYTEEKKGRQTSQQSLRATESGFSVSF